MKTQTELTADTLFAFQMALKGHEKFEFKTSAGDWIKCAGVTSRVPHRICHEIPEGWTRHDGEDWKGDKDAVIEEVMFCDGIIHPLKGKQSLWWASNFSCNDPQYRIYAYKLAAKSPEIPEGFIPWNGGECPVAGHLMAEVKSDAGNIFKGMASQWNWQFIIACRVIEKKVIPWDFATAPVEARVTSKVGGVKYALAFGPDGVGLYPSAFNFQGHLVISYETLAADYLQLDGSVCGKEGEQ